MANRLHFARNVLHLQAKSNCRTNSIGLFMAHNAQFFGFYFYFAQ